VAIGGSTVIFEVTLSFLIILALLSIIIGMIIGISLARPAR
jgi:uncharacterized protein YneF (UPF0154 family)